MIKPNQLRIGNYFIENYDMGENKPKTIELDEDYMEVLMGSRHYEYLYPIPLTPEILFKCGFEKLKGTKSVFRIFINDLEISVNIELFYAYIDTEWGQASIKKPIFKYLHQLQNLIFALTGTELEIKLL